MRYRISIKEFLPCYKNARTTGERDKIFGKVSSRISNTGGRFLRKDETGAFHELDTKRLRLKLQSAFKDAIKNARKEEAIFQEKAMLPTNATVQPAPQLQATLAARPSQISNIRRNQPPLARPFPNQLGDENHFMGLHPEVAAKDKEINDLKRTLAAFHRKLTRLELRNKHPKVQQQEFDEAVAAKDKENARLVQTLADKDQRLKSAIKQQQEIRALNKIVAVKDKGNALLAQELADKELTLKCAMKKQQEIRALNETVATKDKQIDCLVRRLVTKDRDLMSLEHGNRHQQERNLPIGAITRTDSDMAKASAAKDKELHELKRELARMTTNNGLAMNHVEMLDGKVCGLAAALRNTNDALAAKCTENQRLKKLLARQTRALEEEKRKDIQTHCQDAWNELDAFLKENSQAPAEAPGSSSTYAHPGAY